MCWLNHSHEVSRCNRILDLFRIWSWDESRFVGVCASEGGRREDLSFLGFEFGHDWRETGGVDLYSYFFGPLIQAFSFAYKEKRKYPGENLFYWLHNTGIVKPISYPGQVENWGSVYYNGISQWWKLSPWQNHSRKSIFNNWILAIIAARTEIAGSLSSAWGIGTSCSCLTGSFGTKENPNCDDMRLVRVLTLLSTVIFSCWKRAHTPLMVMTVGVLKRISRFISVRSAATGSVHFLPRR